MAEGALMICMIELSGIVATQGLKKYLEHRQELIKDNREDELISNRVKKVMANVYSKMSSREASPLMNEILEVAEDVIPAMESIYEDEKSDDDNRKSITEKVIEMMPQMKTRQRKSLMGFNLQKVREIFTPERVRKIEKELPPEFDSFVKKLCIFIKHELKYIDENDDVALLQKHKHYSDKLTRSLVEQDKLQRSHALEKNNL